MLDENGYRVYTLPLYGGRVAYLRLPPDVTVRDLEFVQRYLDIFREVLTDAQPQQVEEETKTDAQTD